MKYFEGETLEDIILNAKKYDNPYLIIDDDNKFGFLDDIYHNKVNYPYLIEVYDSKEVGMKKLMTKVFKIDYEAFVP